MSLMSRIKQHREKLWSALLNLPSNGVQFLAKCTHCMYPPILLLFSIKSLRVLLVDVDGLEFLCVCERIKLSREVGKAITNSSLAL
jgi:hypothetical protein